MFETPFYSGHIKKIITGFGALFSNVKIIRRHADGTVAEIVKVPIAYGPKEKYISRIESDPELSGGVYITLPRFAFEITGYTYDTSSMTNRNNKIQVSAANGAVFTYTPVPYDISITLSLLSKGTEDGLAVLEQILPLFKPEYTLTIDAIKELDVTVDIPIVLNGVAVSDDYEGDYAIRRFVTHTFDFTAKAKLFGPTLTAGVIYRTDTNLVNQENIHTAVANPDTKETIIDEWSNDS